MMTTKIFQVGYTVDLWVGEELIDSDVDRVKVGTKTFAAAIEIVTKYAKKGRFNFEPYDVDGDDGEALKCQYKNFQITECKILEESDI